MTTIPELRKRIHDAWKAVPTPPADDMKFMSWGWGEQAAAAFTGVAPLEVDRESVGFYAATPLLDLPPRAAAAYLGTFLLSLLDGLAMQHTVGLFTDILQRAHTLTCLENRLFWEQAIRGQLPKPCIEVVRELVTFLIDEQAEALALSDEQIERMVQLCGQP